MSLNVHDYLIDAADLDWSNLLSDWNWLLPSELTVWLVNRYGDIFLLQEDEAVYMLDVGAGTLKRCGESRDDFSARIDQNNNANNWLMIPLVNKCVAAGLQLGPGQCYSYIRSPVLGGEYTVENTKVCDLSEHYSVFGQICGQIKDGSSAKSVGITQAEFPA